MVSKAVFFIGLNDHVPNASPEHNCTYSIQEPAITIEKKDKVFQISARFKLHVEPYPRAIDGPNTGYIHAPFIETVQLRYNHAPHEWHVFEPSADELEAAYLVTESSGHQTSGEAGITGSAAGPSGYAKAGIVKDGKVEWQHTVPPWSMSTGIVPRTSAEGVHGYRWTWTTLSKRKVEMHPSAFDGMSRTIVVTRKVREKDFPLSGAQGVQRTAEEMDYVRVELRKLFHFEFNVEVSMRRLGYGGFWAHWEKGVHWFRAYKPPVEAYKSNTNRGFPVPGLGFKDNLSSFHLGPCGTTHITDHDIRALEGVLPVHGEKTDAVEDAKYQVELANNMVHYKATHIQYVHPDAQENLMFLVNGQQMGGRKIKAVFKNRTW